jgi:hypothetical protein
VVKGVTVVGGRDRLRVPDSLGETATLLEALHNDFRTASSQGDDLKDVAGHSDIRSAIGDFTGNWRRHRDGMLDMLETAAEMAANSHEAYGDTDEALACALEEE